MGARETREKTRKGMRRCGLGGPCHIARPDIRRGRDALLRDPAWHVQKTCNGQYLSCPSEFSWIRTSKFLSHFGGREACLASCEDFSFRWPSSLRCYLRNSPAGVAIQS